MSGLEIFIVVAVSCFSLFWLLKLFGIDLKKVFKFILLGSTQKEDKAKKTKSPKQVKEKPQKHKREKPAKQNPNTKIEKVLGKDAPETLDTLQKDKKDEGENKQEQQQPQKQERAFQITKKGVAKIHKKALERNSRSLSKIEPAVKRTTDGRLVSVTGEELGTFDDFLKKMKDIGDPDELDDETFRRMFMGGMASDSIDEECQSSHDDDEMSGDFTSLETPQNGEIDRSLKRFSIDGSHLRLTQDFDNLPNRKPMLPEHIDFTKRITGKYDNISMGDVSNRLAPKEENNDQANDVTQEQQEPVSNDEDIFAKIMERRRRELGMEPFTPPKFQQDNEIIKPDATEIDLETLILADAISKPAYSRKRK